MTTLFISDLNSNNLLHRLNQQTQTQIKGGKVNQNVLNVFEEFGDDAIIVHGGNDEVFYVNIFLDLGSNNEHSQTT